MTCLSTFQMAVKDVVMLSMAAMDVSDSGRLQLELLV